MLCTCIVIVKCHAAFSVEVRGDVIIIASYEKCATLEQAGLSKITRYLYKRDVLRSNF